MEQIKWKQEQYQNRGDVMNKINNEMLVNQIKWNDVYARNLLKLLCTGDNEEEENYLCNVFMFNFYNFNDECIRKDILHFFQWKIDEGIKYNKHGQDVKLSDLELLYRNKEYDRLHKKLEKLFQEIILERHKQKLLKLLENGKMSLKEIYDNHKDNPYLTIKRMLNK